MSAGAPTENTNAEKWTLEVAEKFFYDALVLVNQQENNVYKYDFVGEVARELKSYKEVFTYLKDKFPELVNKHKQLISTLEANCFYNSKKGNINTAVGIVNLKSNHGWTDRGDFTSGGEKIKSNSVTVNVIKPTDDD